MVAMSLDKIKPYAKAVVAFLVPTAGSLVGAMQDASPGGSTITAAEWIGALIIGVTSSGFVYGTPNRDPLAQRQDESVQPPYVGKHANEEEGMGSDAQPLIARHFADQPKGQKPSTKPGDVSQPNPYWDGI